MNPLIHESVGYVYVELIELGCLFLVRSSLFSVHYAIQKLHRTWQPRFDPLVSLHTTRDT